MNYQQKQVSRSVFRAYDIRGIIGKELDENAFYSIGLALAYYLHQVQRQKVFWPAMVVLPVLIWLQL